MKLTKHPTTKTLELETLILYLLDPADSPSPSGSYLPIKISYVLYHDLVKHPHFNSVAHVEHLPDGTYILYRLRDWKETAHQRAQAAQQNADVRLRNNLLAEARDKALASFIYRKVHGPKPWTPALAKEAFELFFNIWLGSPKDPEALKFLESTEFFKHYTPPHHD